MSIITEAPARQAATPSTTTSPISRLTAPTMTVPRLTGPVLAAVRVVVSFLFLCHGLQGMFGLFGGIDGHGAAVPALSWPGGAASAIEIIGPALVALGLFTRPAAVVCSGAMAYAYFTVHVEIGLFPISNMGEPAVLFCWIFLLIAVVGPGSLALDSLRRGRRA